MSSWPELKRVDLRKRRMFEGKRLHSKCDHPDIDGEKTYLIRSGDQLLIGRPSKQWWGWDFCVGAYGIQLDHIDELWEIKLVGKRRER